MNFLTHEIINIHILYNVGLKKSYARLEVSSFFYQFYLLCLRNEVCNRNDIDNKTLVRKGDFSHCAEVTLTRLKNKVF